MSVTDPQEESSSRHESRSEAERVSRAVGEGQSLILTNGGVRVGRIVPIDDPAPGLTLLRPAQRRGGWAELGINREVVENSAHTLDELREDRI
ncbi:MAG: hypothetical protein QM708_05340 [Propioniciclava sp.]|uniref:hypothetical protein n=1 Tax=Propioniciclava sp. TaxID=2038686 RepID=UPI0039E6D42E